MKDLIYCDVDITNILFTSLLRCAIIMQFKESGNTREIYQSCLLHLQRIINYNIIHFIADGANELVT